MSNAAKALENHDECQLFEAGQFGDHDPMALELSGGSRNLERGVQLRVHEAHPKIFCVATPTSVRQCNVITA